MESSKKQKKDRKHGGKLKGNPARDDPETRLSKTLCYVLRHGAEDEGIPIRPDGYVRVTDLLASPKFRTLDFPTLESIVQQDNKQRYHLIFESVSAAHASLDADSWWIRANQGHSLKEVRADGKKLLSATDVPMAVHGTNEKAWKSILKHGLSRMSRNHIHLAQGLAGQNVVSGMRQTADIFIYIDLQNAMDAGYKFELSANGVILTEGNEAGYLPTEFFERVEKRVSLSERIPLPGWVGNTAQPMIAGDSVEQLQQTVELKDETPS